MMKKACLIGLSLVAAAAAQTYAAEAVMWSADELVWVEHAPGSPVKRAMLWGSRDSGNDYGMLLKLPAGFVSPVHAHNGDYHGLNVAGTWRHSFDGGEQKDLPPGSYVFQPSMGMHSDACIGSEDCILFIHQHSKGSYIRKEQ